LPSTWVLHRFRSAFFHENLPLIVLQLLRDSERTEWEVLSLLYSRYRLTPSAKEFRRLLESLESGGYAAFEPVEGTRRLRITKAGMKLLQGLEDEYREIVSAISGSLSPGTVGR